MALPTVAEVVSDVQSLCGDPGSADVYTDAVVQPFFGIAYREMWDLFMRWNLQTAEAEAAYTLPASTTLLTPATAGITNMGEPVRLWERGSASEDWELMDPIDELPQATPDALLHWWAWEGNAFRFVGALGDRLLKIEYAASGSAPASGSIPVDNSRSFLAVRTASLVAGPIGGQYKLAEKYEKDALGPKRVADGSGGFLRDLVAPMLKEKQKRPVRPQRFRPRRTGANF